MKPCPSPTAIVLQGLLALGCTQTDAGYADALGDDTSAGTLFVTPGEQVSLGYEEEQVFEVFLEGSSGAPVASAPIHVNIVGQAHSALLTPLELTTDEDGIGVVVFRAPAAVIEVDIRFSSPAAGADVLVPVIVDPSLLSLAVDVDYDGVWNLETVRATLHRDFSCEAIAADAQSALVDEAEADAAFPLVFEFDGLLATSTYGVLVTAKNANGDERATTCVDGLAPSSETSVEATDLPLDVAGAYSLGIEVTPDGALDPVVNQLLSTTLAFASLVPTAILDMIRIELSDPDAIERFDEIRQTADLDSVIAADLAARGADPHGDLDSSRLALLDLLEALVATSTMEFGGPVDSTFGFDHWMTGIAPEGAAGDAFLSLSSLEVGQGVATFADDAPDALSFGDHAIPLGLGDVLEHLFGLELSESYGSSGLAEAMESIIDCQAVTSAIQDDLAEVADATALAQGCVDALFAAQMDLAARATVVDSLYWRLAFEDGGCAVPEPSQGAAALSFADGVFTMRWCGDTCLNPMDAVFDGTSTSADR